MATQKNDLLQPSLSIDSSTLAPPSTQAMFLTSFFGGPGAAVAIIAVSSWRLRRASRDWPILLAMLILPFALVAWLQTSSATIELRAWIEDTAGNSGTTLLYRALALICFALGYALHRTEHRNSELMGLQPPNGWVVGLSCLVAGIAISFLVSVAMISMGVKL